MKLPGTPLCLTALGGLLLFGQGTAQPVYIAPLQSVPEILEVFEPLPESRWRLRLMLHARTNVVPLLQPDPPAGALYREPFAYYDQYRVAELRYERGAWRFGYRYEIADRYSGNHAAAQLYLEAVAGRLNPTTAGQVQVSMNRTALNRWWFDYTGDFRLPSVEIRYRVGLSWATVRRLQQGLLTGQKEGVVFRGDMWLHSTAGVPTDERDGSLWAVHTEIALRSRSGWSLFVRGENLASTVDVRRAQRIQAHIVANQFEPDADGFLHATPAIEGRVEPVRLSRRLQPLYQFGLALHTTRPNFALLAQHQFDWRYGIASIYREGWLMLWMPQPAIEIGWRTDRFTLVVRMEHLLPARNRQLSLEISQQL